MTCCRVLLLTLAATTAVAAQDTSKMWGRPPGLHGTPSSRFLEASADAKPQFDVASIKPAPPVLGALRISAPRMQGGPGSTDPGHVIFRNHTLADLIILAYGVKWLQISGPEWITSTTVMSVDGRFEIEAKFPPDTTKDQFHLMVQSLLESRFDLKTHREAKPATVYSLVFSKPNPKLVPSPELPPDTPPEQPGKIGPKGEDGFSTMPPSHSGLFVNVSPTEIHIKFLRQSMPEFAEWLWTQLQHPVYDHTGLKGPFDFYLTRAREVPTPYANAGVAAEPIGTDLAGAVLAQLGLKLTPEKGNLEMLVIDHANRTPTAN